MKTTVTSVVYQCVSHGAVTPAALQLAVIPSACAAAGRTRVRRTLGACGAAGRGVARGAEGAGYGSGPGALRDGLGSGACPAACATVAPAPANVIASKRASPGVAG